MSNFQVILDAADKYAEQTGINLMENPFADKVKGCDSPAAILLLLQKNLRAFRDYRDNNRKFIECLSPVLQVVHTFSGILGEAAGLVSRVTYFHIDLFSLFSTRHRSNLPNSFSLESMYSLLYAPSFKFAG